MSETSRSEDELGRKWDRCITDTSIKFGTSVTAFVETPGCLLVLEAMAVGDVPVRLTTSQDSRPVTGLTGDDEGQGSRPTFLHVFFF